jgi:hypothetical protein
MRLEAIHFDRKLELRVGKVDPANERAALGHPVFGNGTRNAMGAQQGRHPSLEDAGRKRGIGALVEKATKTTDARASFARYGIERRSHAHHRRQAAAKSAIECPRHDPKPCDRTQVDERPLDDGAWNAVDRRDPSVIQIGYAMHDDASRHRRLRSGNGDLD